MTDLSPLDPYLHLFAPYVVALATLIAAVLVALVLGCLAVAGIVAWLLDVWAVVEPEES